MAQGGAEDDPRDLRRDADQSADAGAGPERRSPTWREEFGLALLVDATFASPINFRPLEHGADVVITSATKYLNGHSDVIAGAVAGSASFIEEVAPADAVWGQAIDPHAAWLIDRGMRTLAVRMERHNANGLAVAALGASQHAAFARVHYPGLAVASRPCGRRARCSAASAAWSGLELAGGVAAAERLLKRLRLIAHAPSLAGVESLVSEPRLTSHKAPRRRSSARRSAFPDGFVRLSCGIEDADDMIADLEQAVGGRARGVRLASCPAPRLRAPLLPLP